MWCCAGDVDSCRVRPSRRHSDDAPWCRPPRHVADEFRAAFNENALWSRGQGIFVIVDADEQILGNVDWEQLNGSVQDVEAAYRIYSRDNWGKGIATEALQLLTRWLFDSMPVNRIRLVVHVDNIGSHRVAEKCGYSKSGCHKPRGTIGVSGMTLTST